MTRSIRRITRAGIAAAAVAGLGFTLTACGNDAPQNEVVVSEDAVQAALDQGGDLLVWAWEPTLQATVDAFRAEYPQVNVQLVNVGSGAAHYTALQNAIAAGSGIPDIAQIEYMAIEQFNITHDLADLAPFGAAELADRFVPSAWDAVTSGDGIYGMPIGGGPMVLFYREDVLAEHGITEPPATWDELIEMMRTLHAEDPNLYVGSAPMDFGSMLGLLWAAGARPFSVDGTTVGVNLADDPGVQRVAGVWQTLVDEGLMFPQLNWTDDWFRALGDGSIVFLPMGAWMPGNLIGSVPAGEGHWRVAPLPQFEAGSTATGHHGGSTLAIMEASPNKALAYGFLRFAGAGDGVQPRVDDGIFPDTVAQLTDPAWLDREVPYFGGQQINRVLGAAAENALPGWQFLPFQVYANSIYSDTVGQAFIGQGTIMDGMRSWQDRLLDFARTQGFTVE